MPLHKSPSAEPQFPPDEDINTVNDNIDVEDLSPPKVNPLSSEVVYNLAGLRNDFKDFREKKQREYAKKLADLKKRFTQRIEEEQSEQDTHVRELLERLDRAIEKKAAYEDAMTQLIASMNNDKANFEQALSSIYAERVKQCQEGITMCEQQPRGSPLIQAEQNVRARLDNLRE